MITLTPQAEAAVQRFMEKSERPVTGLRITVSNGGCSGLQYGMSLEEQAEETDTIVESGRIKVYLSPETIPMITGVKVGFVESLEGAGFSFDSPNATNQCKCGKSFSN